MALELENGYPRLFVDYGSGTVQVNHSEIKLTDGNFHHIDITWNNMVRLVFGKRREKLFFLTFPRFVSEHRAGGGQLQEIVVLEPDGSGRAKRISKRERSPAVRRCSDRSSRGRLQHELVLQAHRGRFRRLHQQLDF